MDMVDKPFTDELFDMVTMGSRISLDEVRKHPAGTIFPDPDAIVAEKDEAPNVTARFEPSVQTPGA